MNFLFAVVLTAGTIVALLDARNVPVNSRRTFGNFEPELQKSFEIQPRQLVESRLFNNDPISIAKHFVSLKSGQIIDSVVVSSSHQNKRNGVTHVYLQQQVNGISVSNGVANVNVDQSGKIVSVGNSFFTGEMPAASFAPKLSASEAVTAFASFLHLESPLPSSLRTSQVSTNSVKVSGASFATGDIPAELNYIQIESGSKLVLAWSLQVELEDNMYNAHVDVENGQVVSLIDWVADATYNVYRFGINDPDSGSRTLISNPENSLASPAGWHSQPNNRDFTNTQGNNVHAQNNPSGGTSYENNYRPDAGASMNFNYPINFNQAPSQYQDAAITNLFYWNNIIHDFLYVYGFDEDAGNFQYYNFGRGGAGNDAVVAFAQDGSGTNNANFMTPPDGSQGRMRMYIWTATNPARDGDLDGGIVMHEYAHGLSNRLTGGRTDVSCLGSGQPGGMGEGWGDLLATVTRTTVNSTRADNYGMGDYSSNIPIGIRKYVYSTNLQTNPSTFGFLQQSEYFGVHRIGEVWAVILYEVFWNLVDQNGFDPNWFNVNSNAGNVKFIQLVVDGMKLQPCRPTFLDARNAIIQADELNNNGANKCAIWRGFAKRGLGVNATPGNGSGENFEVPQGC